MNQKDEKLTQDTDPLETQEWLESLQAVGGGYPFNSLPKSSSQPRS